MLQRRLEMEMEVSRMKSVLVSSMQADINTLQGYNLCYFKIKEYLDLAGPYYYIKVQRTTIQNIFICFMHAWETSHILISGNSVTCRATWVATSYSYCFRFCASSLSSLRPVSPLNWSNVG